MCITDYCPHSYSYRMILIRTHFIFISLARFCIWYTVLELTIELVRIFVNINRATQTKWVSSLLFAPGKVGVRVILINRETSSFVGKIGTRGIIIRSFERLSVASNLISVRVPVCALSTLVY